MDQVQYLLFGFWHISKPKYGDTLRIGPGDEVSEDGDLYVLRLTKTGA